MITKETLRLFRNSNSFLKTINTEYSDQFAREGAKIGASLNIRKPVDYTVRSGPTASYQNTTETYTTLVISTQLGVDMSFSSADMALSIDKFSQRYIKPAVNNLAGSVAAAVMSMVDGGTGQGPVANFVHNVDGSNNTITPSASTWLQAGAILDANSAPRGDGQRIAMIDNLSNARTVSGLSGFYNPQVRISEQSTSGMMNKEFLGLDWYTDQTIIKHTTGTFSAGALSAAGYVGSTLPVGAITGTLNRGDIISIAGVNQVNRVTKVSTGTPMLFTVTANVASGATSIPIYPALIPSNAGAQVQYQTVDVSPASGAAVTLANKASEVYRKNLVYVPEAFTLATVDLPFISKGVVDCARENFDGISMRMITTYDPINDILGTRLDILFGYALLRPEWVVAVADAV
jgi:hypothetical protein